MGTIGFSYVGAVVVLLLLVPNVLWLKKQPQACSCVPENTVLRVLEQAGQALTVGCLLVFSDLNVRVWSLWCGWLMAAGAAMLLYELWWVRYFRGGCQPELLYRRFAGIPLAGAVLPVAAFVLLSVYGRLIWLMLSAALFGIGHIGIHYQHQTEWLASNQK